MSTADAEVGRDLGSIDEPLSLRPEGSLGKTPYIMRTQHHLLSLLLLLVVAAGCASKQSPATASSTDQILTVAVSQYEIIGSKTSDEFLSRIEKIAEQAAAQQAEVLVLPEWAVLDTWPLGSGLAGRVVLENIADNLTPLYVEKLRKLASKHQLLIIGGSTARKTGNKIYNSTPVVFPDSKVVFQDKVYLTHWEEEQNLSEGQEIVRFEYRGVSFVVLICYDVEFPNLSVELATNRPELIFVPSMTESAEGLQRVTRTARARAVELTSFVITSATVGEPSKGWRHYGQSELAIPQITGLKAQEKRARLGKEELLILKLPMNELRRVREDSPWQPALKMKARE